MGLALLSCGLFLVFRRGYLYSAQQRDPRRDIVASTYSKDVLLGCCLNSYRAVFLADEICTFERVGRKRLTVK